MPINYSIIKLKIQDIIKNLNLNYEFKISDNYINNFLKRNYFSKIINFSTVGKIDENIFVDDLKIIKNKIKNYKPEIIYNLDETSIYYKILPNYTFASKKFKGFKTDKSRITIALCLNSDGYDILNPIIIHKFKFIKI